MKNKLLLRMILLFTLFMGIGYAAVHSITLDFQGTLTAKELKDIYITDVYYVDSLDAVVENSKINYANQTVLSSHVNLSNTNPNSYITYRVTIYNSTDTDYKFKSSNYITGADTYSNTDISFQLIGLAEGNALNSKQNITFDIKFYYKNNTLPSNKQLTSIISFVFEEKEELIAGTLINSGNNSSECFGYAVSKSSIEAIKTVDHTNIPTGATTWDASIEQNGSITGWIVDTDNNSYYELYLGTTLGKISLPADSSYMFSSYSNAKVMDLSNLSTANVTNMSYMFYYLYATPTLDLSNFDTSNVTDMSYMFYYSAGLTSLDVSSFDTKKVMYMNSMFGNLMNITTLDLSSFETPSLVNMNSMFYFSYGLINLDMRNFDASNVTNMTYTFYYLYKLENLYLNSASFNASMTAQMTFYYVPSTVYIVAKDDTARNWIQEKFGSGKGTIVTVAEL